MVASALPLATTDAVPLLGVYVYNFVLFTASHARVVVCFSRVITNDGGTHVAHGVRPSRLNVSGKTGNSGNVHSSTRFQTPRK